MPELARAWLVLLVALIGLPILSAQAADPETVLIRNVRLIDRDGQAKDVVVTILIKNGKLDLVTPDEIAVEDVTLAVDARHGTLLGSLEPGKPPSFLILDKDPREDFDVLLDTATHVRFAVREGAIVKNTLLSAIDAVPEAKPKEKGWLAYTPPPLALPVSYQEDKWNKWEGDYVSGTFLAIVAMDRQRWFSQDDVSEQPA
jgi:phosphate-selective porin OprO/OprP